MRLRIARTAAAAAAITILAGGLAGCAGGPSDSDGTVELSWWGWNPTDYKAAIEEFEKENPDIKVTFKQFAYNDYVTALRPGLTSSDGPDVFQVQPGELVTNFGPLAVPLEDPMAAEYGDDWADDFNAEGLSQLQLDGEQVALPSYMSGAGLIYYNQTILDQFGLTVPTTFDEWKTACGTLAAGGIDCLAHGAKDAWVNTDVFISLAQSVAPGAVYDAIDGEKAWTDPEFVDAMNAWRELFTSGIVAPGATAAAEYPDAHTAFLTGKAAFIALGTWNTPATMTNAGRALTQETVTDEITGVTLTAPFPKPSGNDSTTPLFGGPDNGWAVSASSKKQDAAVKLVEWLVAGAGQELQASVGNFPAKTSVTVRTDDVIDPSQVADIERQSEAVANLSGARQIPYAELTTAIGDALSAVAAGTSTPEDALDQIESASQTVDRGN